MLDRCNNKMDQIAYLGSSVQIWPGRPALSKWFQSCRSAVITFIASCFYCPWSVLLFMWIIVHLILATWVTLTRIHFRVFLAKCGSKWEVGKSCNQINHWEISSFSCSEFCEWISMLKVGIKISLAIVKQDSGWFIMWEWYATKFYDFHG